MREMKLGVILSVTGSHAAGWLHPSAQDDAAYNVQRHVEVAQMAEAAKLDFVFLADSLALQGVPMETLSRTANFGIRLEPITALSAVAMCTKHIGLVATASTTYQEPYHVARKFASLDHISNGRAGWNLVTSSTETEALNFSRDEHLAHGDRYARANEFADVVRGLWDSWDADVLVRDRANARYLRPEGLHVLDHVGEHFKVRGPLTVPRAPQGHPLIFQAGSSGPGMELAARTADCVFTAQPDIDEARAFYKEIKAMAATFGRDPDHVKIMVGLNPIVGKTRGEAEAKARELEELVHPAVGLGLLGMALGMEIDPDKYPYDGPVPDFPETNSSRSRRALLLDMARKENLTLRQLAYRQVNSAAHRCVVGTAEDTADVMEEMFDSGAADGFLIAPAVIPFNVADFTQLVVPELRRRGRFRSEYEGGTLRENLGLPVVDWPYRQEPAPAEESVSG